MSLSNLCKYKWLLLKGNKAESEIIYVFKESGLLEIYINGNECHLPICFRYDRVNTIRINEDKVKYSYFRGGYLLLVFPSKLKLFFISYEKSNRLNIKFSSVVYSNIIKRSERTFNNTEVVKNTIYNEYFCNYRDDENPFYEVLGDEEAAIAWINID